MPNNWAQPETLSDWMRQIEKRLMSEERRPRISKAADLLGPGVAPQAVEIPGWNSEATLFNGFFYSRPGALHTPDSSKWWIGVNIAQPEGYGVQRVWDYRSSVSPPPSYVRTYSAVGGTRLFTTWELAGGGGDAGTVAWEAITGKPTEFQPKTYVHEQGVASDTWIITHNLGYYPSVTVVDSAGSVVVGDLTYNSANTVTASFGGAFGGKAYLS